MNSRVSGVVGVVRAVIASVQSDRITFIAASLAYYAFISLVPLLLLGIVAASVLGGPELAASLGTAASNVAGEEAGAVVQAALLNAAGRGGATLVGTAVLLWSGLKLFRGLDVAFSTVYGTAGNETLLDQLRDGSVTLVGVGLGIAVTVGLGVVTAQFDRVVAGVDVFNVAGTVVSLVGLTLAFFPLYYVLPDQGTVGVREALPGAVFAAVGWTLLQTGFRVYAGVAGSYEAYGALGAVLLLVTFLYFGGLVLLVGVVLNAVLADRVASAADIDATDDAEADQRGLSPTRSTGADVADDDTEAELRELRRRLAEFEAEVDERTVDREELEGDLKRYVRSRMRRGKARGWGPYLVLLYGTAMTLGAFVYLSGGWAILAMLVVWLSTLGLYVLMLLVGAGVSLASLPGSLRDRIGDRN